MCQVCAKLGSDYGDLHPDRSLIRGGHSRHQHDTGDAVIDHGGEGNHGLGDLDME